MNDVVVRIGDKGPHVELIQRALAKAGFWDLDYFTQTFGEKTDEKVREFQKANGLVVDGRVGESTLGLLGVNIPNASSNVSGIRRWDGVTINGSVFPDAKIDSNVRVRLNSEMVNEYLPVIKTMGLNKGLELLCTVMAYKEGFRAGTRSYRTNNPGNIGNTDSGANKTNKSLKDGITLQVNYINGIINGKNKAFPIGKEKVIKPYYSPEIAKHQKAYGMSPYLPGYKFVFTGQLDQFVKIYSTGARGGNGYLSMILSFFKQNGIEINERTTLQEIVNIK